MKIPADLKYTKEDEWVRVEGDEWVIGITDYAQDALSDIVYVELPDEDESFGTGDAFGVVESVKAASDLYMPVDGKVVAVNEDLMDAPEKINEDPYGEAWMIRIAPSDQSQLDDLMDADAYEAYCAERD
jgi:glycine cleavage system H protein